jgi:hypothetical protein
MRQPFVKGALTKNPKDFPRENSVPVDSETESEKMNRLKLFAPAPLPPPATPDWPSRDLLIRRSMKLLGWVRFKWDLLRLTVATSQLPTHYQIAYATDEDDVGVRKVFSSSFMLDPAWNPAVREIMRTVDSWLDRALVSDLSACLVLRHGQRIIGASVLSFDPEAENHLAPGPSILMEYRNRGFGTRLFERSLNSLREAGLVRACGIARENAPVARFLYPKFGGVAEPANLVPLLAA